MMRLTVILFLMICFSSENYFAQEEGNFFSKFRRKKIEVKVNKTGPYVGLQNGKYLLAEFGAERQYKRIKLVNPETNAFRFGFNYNYTENVLGYDLGYWHQRGRLGLTYGGNIVMRTNFDDVRIGIAPVVGFKFTQFHLQTGYNFLTRTNHTYEYTNTFFISLRFVIINERKFEMELSDKKKKTTKKPLFHNEKKK